MNDSKSGRQDALTVYHAYWNSYLKGDMEAMASFIADDFQVIGSTESEVFPDKRETMQFYEAISDQVVGKVEFRNRNIQQKPNNGIVSITEFSDAYILLDDEWVFYSKFRITSLLQKKEDGWKFIQQHGSIPDTRAQEGEQVASEKMRQENLELREAVKRRTEELENKNRELEIEASLERVRAIALSMKKPTDMLEVCRVISNQLTQFNVKDIRNVQTVIINESKRSYLNYQYFTAYERLVTEETDPAKHPTVLEMVSAMQKSADSFFSGSLESHKLDEFRKYREKENQFPDPILEKTDAIYYYFYSIGQGGLGITTYGPLPAEGLGIFKRFHNVFKLAYQRFLDIEKAEAQAREAQIEASLERVRSLALGMRRSKEVGGVSDGFFAEFNKLTVKILGCSIVVIDEEKDSMELWRARSGVVVKPFDSISFSSSMQILKKNLPGWYPVFINALKKKNNFLMDEVSGEKRVQTINSMAEQSNFSNEEKTRLFKSIPENFITYYIYFKLGYLALITEEKLPDENIAIARRFVDVFGFAYTRFLDIKKAEEQAREAKIETALERVRARTMAMQHSDELLEASDVMLAQLEKLEINALRIGICTIDRETGAAEIWSRSEHKGKKQNSILGVVPLGTHPVFDDMVKAWRKKKPYFVSERAGDEVKEYYTKVAPCLSYPVHKEYNEQESISAFFFKEGSLNVISLEPLDKEERRIMIRFAKAFGQMYTRFLDLQKAEAQAREARIETALERVRAKAMAMHNSDDLAQTVDVFFKELKSLDVRPHRCGVTLIDAETHIADLTVTTAKGKNTDLKMTGKLTLAGHPVLEDVYNSWKRQKEYHPVLKGAKIKEYYNAMNPEIEYPDSTNDAIQYGHYFYFKEGGVFAWTDKELPESSLNIFRKFTSVLSLTYRRYLDLIEAEAQAREAQIETALERVRTLAMSMHKSNDLTKAVATVFSELNQLGLKTIRCGIGIMQGKNKLVDVWTTSSTDKNDSLHVSGNEKLEGHPLLDKIYSFWQNQMDFDYLLKGEDLREYYKITSQSNLKVPAPITNKTANEKLRQHYYCVMFPAGGLFAFRESEFSEEAKILMRRFSDVFHLAFTRHLDLKQAEEQNKIIQAENKRKSQELEEARQMQLSMLPKNIPQVSNLDTAVYMQTATEVGGDYYDFSFQDDGSLNVALGDATGHGMKAGIMVSSMKSIFTTNSPKMDIEPFFETANSGVKSMGLKRMMMGFIMLNIKGNVLKFINAGMPPLFLFRKSLDVVEELKEHGLPIGAMGHTQYGATKLKLGKGDTLLLMSDGMPELQNGNNEMYGYERLCKLFKNVADQSTHEIIARLKNEGAAWMDDAPPDDDVTFVVIKVK